VELENTPSPVHMISLIIPVRFSSMLFEGAERLERLIQNAPPEHYEVVVVDYGSSKNEAKTIETITQKFSHARVVRADTERLPFSIGDARNIGAQHAIHDVIMFCDVDCLGGVDMFRKIAQEATIRNIRENAYDFFMIPIAFLTYEGAEEFNRIHKELPYPDYVFHQHILSANKRFILSMAYSGTTSVLNRRHYLALGGVNQIFHGHGAEDFELNLRLAYYNPITTTMPVDYYHETRNNQIKEYVGFRAYLSLYGLETFYKGIYMVHLWHPVREASKVSAHTPDSQYRQTGRNFALLRQLMQRFDQDRSQPFALPDLNNVKKSLVFFRQSTSVANLLRHVLPHLGQFTVTEETKFQTELDLIRFIEQEGYSQVLMLNPYGNAHRLRMYHALHEHGTRCLVFERGALPDSWFFDANGFNADSSSYAPDKWDKDIGPDGHDLVHAYTQRLRSSAETLEKNGEPKSYSYWHTALNIGHRKVVFVPLQRPSDTVTRFFGGNVGQYDNFYAWIASIAETLDPSKWIVIVKKHPLEVSTPAVSGVTFVPEDAHIHDLIDLADVILLLNSGVGVLSLAFGKPVVPCGRAFYAQPGLAKEATSISEAVEAIETATIPDMQKVDRFLHYLINEFYSFGKALYVEKKGKDGGNLSITKEIVWSSLRQISDDTILFGNPRKPAGFDAPIFNSFGCTETMARARNSKLISKSTTPVAKPLMTSASASKPAAPPVPPTKPDSVSDANQVTEGTFITNARDAFRAGNYRLAASCLEQAARVSKTPTPRYRAAAEALVDAGDITAAVALLKKTSLTAKDKAPIERRIKELSRSPLIRKFLPEKKYMGLAKLMA